MWLSTLEIGAAQLRFVTEIAPKSALLCVNGSPIRCGIPVAAKAISYSVNIAQMCYDNDDFSLQVQALLL